MVCRCASDEEHARRQAASAYESERANKEYYEKKVAQLEARVASFTAPPRQYEILEIHEGNKLALKVRYPSCTECSFEGTKVLVFDGVTLRDVVLWREIDPHFRDPKAPRTRNVAPSPVARFPGSDEGWAAAVQYAG